MELREQITREASALAERVTAAAEDAIADARRHADAAVSALRAEVEGIRAELQAATERAAALGTDVETANARVAALEATLEAETTRAGDVTARLEAETARASSLAAQLEAETARAAALAADLEAANQILGDADGARARAESAKEAAASELRAVRELLESARAEATRASEALEVEAAQKLLLQQAHDTAVRRMELELEEATAQARVLEVSFSQADTQYRQAAAAAEAEIESLRQQLDAQAGAAAEAQSRVEAAEAAAAAMRAEVEEAHAIADAAGSEMTVQKERLRKATAMLGHTAGALQALDGATTVPGIFGVLVQQLATQFERVAVFRLKGNHFEGDLAAGVDASVDIKKIVIPRGMGSLITRAAASGQLEVVPKEQIDEARPPFGGSPASALAAPLLFQGELLAVAYADADTAFTDAHAPFAGVLVRHANALLARLAEEINSSRQLREYARTLLDETRTMFMADLQAGLPDHHRIRRLHDSLQYAYDLYAQRAALEAPLSGDLMDEEVAAVIAADPQAPFAADLGAILQDRDARRTAS